MAHRSHRYRLLLPGPCLLLASRLFAGDWANLPTPPPLGPNGGSVLAVSPTDSNTILVGGYSGLVRSTDGGATWATAGLGCSVTDIKFAVSPSGRAFAACYDGSIFRSNDSGLNWATVLPSQRFDEESSTKLAVSKISPGTVFTAFSQEHFGLDLVSEMSTISRSEDGGTSWNPIFSTGILVTDLAIARTTPETIFASVAYYARVGAGGTGGLMRSRDGGQTWEPLPGLARPTDHIAVSADDPSEILATEGSLIYRSADSGSSWALAKDLAPYNVTALLFDPASETAYAGTDGAGVFRSADGGRTWESFSQGLRDLTVTCLATNSSGTRVYAGGASGVVSVSAIDVPCTPSGTTLCLDGAPGDRRFQVRVDYSTTQGAGSNGSGHAIPLAPAGITHGGAFWFFSPDNPELLVKVLDGCSINDKEWFFASAATNVGFVITVTDTKAGAQKLYTNTDLSVPEPIQDTSFSTCSLASQETASSARHGGQQDSDDSASAPVIFGCLPNDRTLCIDGQPGDRRFKIEIEYRTSQGGGATGSGHAIPLSPFGIVHGGAFWFFSPDNPEMLVKVLDGCGINGNKWFFASAGTNVGYTMTLTDTSTGQQKIYTNADLHPADPILDTAAFDTCP